MHITKDGRFISESDCKKWFERLCKCGHTYGVHLNDSCHVANFESKPYCSCEKFRLKESK